MAIDVDLLQQEYLRRARSHGAAVRTNARVTGIRHDEQWYLAINGTTVRCTHVVNAAGAWADEVAIMAGLRPIGLTPLRRTAFLFPAPRGGGHESWPCTIGIDEDWYFEPHGPLMLGSNADEHPDVPRDVRAEDIDVAEAIEKINTITTLSIRRVLKQWAGLRTFAADRLPVVGSDRTEPTFHWYAGLGGFGIIDVTGAGAGPRRPGTDAAGPGRADVRDLGDGIPRDVQRPLNKLVRGLAARWDREIEPELCVSVSWWETDGRVQCAASSVRKPSRDAGWPTVRLHLAGDDLHGCRRALLRAA